MKIIFTVLTLLISFSAKALIIGGSSITEDNKGQFIELSTPFTESNPNNTVGQNNFNNANLYAFNEDQNIILPGQITVDILADGTPGFLNTNTVVASHYVFFDPKNAKRQTGFVDFDAPILAILIQTFTLSATDFLMNNNVNYLSPTLRGLESGDIVGIDDNLDYRLNIDWFAGTPGDYIRVLTAQSPDAGDPRPPEGIPEPTTLLLLSLGLIALRLRSKA
ncbi:MAG: PEP-CTERM sorting domain-containing protein [Porticoccus sp.]|nr:PEP-CTERM sorting domain-containing protein [Porticoccus sp.]